MGDALQNSASCANSYEKHHQNLLCLQAGFIRSLKHQQYQNHRLLGVSVVQLVPCTSKITYQAAECLALMFFSLQITRGLILFPSHHYRSLGKTSCRFSLVRSSRSGKKTSGGGWTWNVYLKFQRPSKVEDQHPHSRHLTPKTS